MFCSKFQNVCRLGRHPSDERQEVLYENIVSSKTKMSVPVRIVRHNIIPYLKIYQLVSTL